MKTGRKTAGILLFAMAAVTGIPATVIRILEKSTGNIFFISDSVNSQRRQITLLFCISLIFCFIGLLVYFGKKLHPLLRVLIVFLLLFTCFTGLAGLALRADFIYFHEYSPDGKTELILADHGFLIAQTADVYVRVGPFFMKRLTNEEKKHIEWFYKDWYTVDWYEGYVIIDGYTYRLPS